MTKVLLIEEDVQLTYFIQRNLTINGHIVAAAPAVKFAVSMMVSFRPDVIVMRENVDVDVQDIPVVYFDSEHPETIVDDIVALIGDATQPSLAQ
jgi:two-component SAPR family response regulator